MSTLDARLGHTIAGKSREGFVVDALLAVADEGTTAHFYCTAVGAEVAPTRKLVIYPGAERFALRSDVEAVPLPTAMRELLDVTWSLSS